MNTTLCSELQHGRHNDLEERQKKKKEAESKKHDDLWSRKNRMALAPLKNHYVAVIAYYHENTRLHEKIINWRAHSAAKWLLSAASAADGRLAAD